MNKAAAYDIICFSLSRFDSPVSSPGLSLAREFSKTHRVFYIEHPFSWKDLVTEWKTGPVRQRRKSWFGNGNRYLNPKNESGDLTIVIPPLTLPVNFLPEGKLYDRISARNDALLFSMLRKLIADYKVERFLFINFFDPFFFRKFPADIQPWKTVYQSMDDISQVAYTARHGVRLEVEAVRRSDLTICTSMALTRRHSVHSNQVHYLPNGVDTSLFDQVPEGVPEELRSTRQPVIGYVGSIEYRMDFALMIAAARAHPDKLFCFVGPVASDDPLLHELRSLPNVLFTGPKPHQEIPAYIHRFDVTCIPFLCNTLTKSIYPLKVNEYLLAGKPVVTTDFSDDIRSFSPYVYVAQDANSFISFLGKALDELPGSSEARMGLARQNSWHQRALAFFNLLDG